jgi:hypothetical protein
LLLDKGADVNARDNDGHTPLDAMTDTDMGLSQVLIEHGGRRTRRTFID